MYFILLEVILNCCLTLVFNFITIKIANLLIFHFTYIMNSTAFYLELSHQEVINIYILNEGVMPYLINIMFIRYFKNSL